MNDPTPREDGPALQKLFTQLDGPQTYEVKVPEGQDLLAKQGDNVAAFPGQTHEAPESDAVVVDSMLNYPKKLHEAGEVAITMMRGVVEAELANGTAQYVPEHVMGWYAMTMAYQLCLLEACNAELKGRETHVALLKSAVRAMKRHGTAYAKSVLGEVDATLRERANLIGQIVPGLDTTYGGELPADIASR